MNTIKSDKEIAFLHDLFVATDWGERFAELIDQNVDLPAKGRALYVGSGTRCRLSGRVLVYARPDEQSVGRNKELFAVRWQSRCIARRGFGLFLNSLLLASASQSAVAAWP
jgi:hypothetical protein